MSQAGAAGFFGKLPAKGDFIGAGLSEGFTRAWDRWLQSLMVDMQARLGDEWLDTYLTMPIVRFAVPRNVVSAQPIVGVLMPSVDRVGRYFPFTIAIELPEGASALAVAASGGSWFDNVEAAALELLDVDDVELDAVIARLDAVGAPSPVAPLAGQNDGAFRRASGEQGLAAMVGNVLEARTSDDHVLSWVALGDGFEYCLSSGLLQLDALLDLCEPVLSSLDGSAQPAMTAGFTGVGHVRERNEDAFFVDPMRSLAVVADGMGGHESGEVASAAVIRGLENVVLDGDLGMRVTQVRQAMEEVNAELWRYGQSLGPDRICGATVVVMVWVNDRYMLLWSGDSRAYLQRDNQVAQMTRDHEAPGGGVTHACGADPVLTLDASEGQLRAGDRMFLCSDGVYRFVSVEETLDEFRDRPVCDVAAVFEERILNTDAADNYTGVIVAPGT